MPPPRHRLLVGLVSSLVAGMAAGLVDGLWSWSASSQFLATPGKLRLLVYLAASAGLVALIGGGLITLAGIALGDWTRLGDLARRARAVPPRTWLSLVTGLPIAAIALVIAGEAAAATLDGKRHFGLVIAVTMGATIGALGLAALAAFALGAVVEHALGPTEIRPRTPARLALVGVAVLGALVVHRYWETLRVLPLRGPAVAGLALAFGFGFAPAARRLIQPVTARPAWQRAAVIAAAAAALLVATLSAGDRDGVMKAARAYSGLGEPVARALRPLGDLDRDGYSRLLGGGDCDDGDRTIHPGAEDIPDDGIDQNCVAGDRTARRRTIDELGFAAVPPSLPADFNVLLITIDTLRADHLGAYGYRRDTSPNLDALAARGALFEHGWAHAPSTRYSMPAILTGRLPLDVRYDHTVQGWPGLLPEATTLAEVLRARGLATAAIVNHWYFDKVRRMDQGFDSYDNENKRLHPGVAGKGPAETRGSSSKEQTDKAIAKVGELADRRFFLWVHYYDPHYAYERHDGVPSFGDGRVDLYDHEIRYTDQEIGRLFDELARRGLDERTVVVVTGDHGEGFGEKGIDMHGYHLYAPQTRVPFIVRVPGQPARRVRTPVGHVDILPTLANLAGAEPSLEMMGRSLVDLLGGEADPDADRVVFQQLSYENNNELRAAVSQRCHVIYNVSPATSWEVYRIDEDPAERRDVVDDPGPCQEVRDALGAWYDAAEIPEGATEALLDGRPEVADPLDLDLGGEVRLLDVAAPATVKAGSRFEVTWTFEARGTLDAGWKVFAHFDGPGKTFQGDHAPPRRFDWWRRGQFIRYTTTVTVPASQRAGRYTLWIGLWKGDRRRPARASGRAVEIVDDRAAVAEIEVTR